MKKMCVLILLVTAFFAMADAPKSEGRFDVDGTKEGIVITLGKISDGGWSGKASWMDAVKNEQYIMANFNADSAWKKGAFSFTPDKDGNVDIILRSRWVEDGETIPWVLIDDITLVDGAVMVNGNFEKGSSGWTLSGGDSNKASIVKKGHSNGHAVRVAHDSPARQTIKVRKGKTVKIIYWFKAAE